MSQKSLLGTLTGEFFQPVRLHYQVFDERALLQAFARLRCVQHVPVQERWVWLYEDEARGLALPNSYEKIPAKLRPIVIGSFLRRAGEMLLDVRSCERAILAVPFFDQHISRSAAQVSDAEVVTGLFPLEGNERLMPADFFDGPPAVTAGETLPLIERFPIYFYEDEMAGFTLALRLRQMVAREHFFGNSAFTLQDAIRKVV